MSYLNTVPLVWGMLHGQQRSEFELSFAIPSECARQLEDGRADIGIVPVAALLDQKLAIFRGAGIACRGPVRSILLISKVSFGRIRTLATDSSSRSSVLLSRIILAHRHGVEPSLISMPPDMGAMLEAADACLIIGDPALLLDPNELRESGFYVADLGADWVEMTGLPMVYAVWAGRADLVNPAREQAFIDSAHYGMEHLDDIVAAEYQRRGVTAALARQYLLENVAFDLGEREYQGMQLYLKYASEVTSKSALSTL